MVLNKTIIS